MRSFRVSVIKNEYVNAETDRVRMLIEGAFSSTLGLRLKSQMIEARTFVKEPTTPFAQRFEEDLPNDIMSQASHERTCTLSFPFDCFSFSPESYNLTV